ncbi:hypothetical protein [Pontibacter oryzae]|uniref:Uncharacterized protein n=1 Tax=Pontibacter oryzae TaxID=2304593 RepID=A0A399SJI6_9BACT|nr:hypothetical protein [Pontibacter oryzae]RIJ43069.1 hypothetical protein D1627_04350 [Pontibacter oryzae]
MKKTILIIVMSFISLNTYAQTLNLDQLLYIVKQDVDDVDSYLSIRKWTFNSSEDLGDYNTKVTWNFSPNIYDSEKALAWLNVKFYGDGNNWLYYQTPSKETYTVIKQKVLSYGMKKISSGANEDGIYSTYVGQNYVIVLSVTKVEGNYSDVSTNIIKIYPKTDYFEYVASGRDM